MRITYLHQYFNTPTMPGSTRSYEFGRRLVTSGHEVNLVTSLRDSKNKKNWFESNEAGMRVHWLPVPYSNRMGYRERIRSFIRFALLSAAKAASLRADVIFASSTPLTIAFPAVHAAKKQKVPLVFEVRDLWPEIPIAIGALRNPLLRHASRILEKWAYRHSSVVVALSPGIKRGISDLGFPENRIGVIPNGSDNTEFAHNEKAGRRFRESRPWLQDRPLVAYGGTFGAVNGVGYMVDLAVNLKKHNSDIRILLVGDGSQLEYLLEVARRNGVLGQNLFIEPPMPKQEAPSLLSASTMMASLFIDVPELRSNSANKFFDSLAASKPILLNYGGWMHDMVMLNNCGLPMWRRPMSEVAFKLHSAMHDSAWLAQAGFAARKLAEKHFDRNILASQLEKLLVAAKNRSSHIASSIAPGLFC